jgi:hypothetical protein
MPDPLVDDSFNLHRIHNYIIYANAPQTYLRRSVLLRDQRTSFQECINGLPTQARRHDNADSITGNIISTELYAENHTLLFDIRASRHYLGM